MSNVSLTALKPADVHASKNAATEFPIAEGNAERVALEYSVDICKCSKDAPAIVIVGDRTIGLGMKVNKFQLEKLITVLRWPVVVFGAIYLVCMIVAPWIMGEWRWSYVQDVWDRWQGVNVGILAFAASFIAFEITRYNEHRQRKREFLAARAFLPEALSELSTYLKASADVHMAAWNDATQITFPSAPSQYKEVFGDCIRHADFDTGDQLSALLSEILMWLQVHTARLEQFIANPAHTSAMKRLTVIDGLRLVGELQARVNRLFDFARGMGELDSRPLAWDDYRTAYFNLGLHVEDLALGDFSLENKTKLHIEKTNK